MIPNLKGINDLKVKFKSLKKSTITLDNKIVISQMMIEYTVKKIGKSSIALFFSGGKDSLVCADIIRKMYGKIPFKIFFIDSGIEFLETYKFINYLKQKWQIKIQVYHLPKSSVIKDISPLQLANLTRITAKKIVKENNIRCLIYGGRSDEAIRHQGFFLKQESVIFFYPIFHFSKEDVWAYIKKFRISYLPLYDQGYSHIEAEPFTFKNQGT